MTVASALFCKHIGGCSLGLPAWVSSGLTRAAPALELVVLQLTVLLLALLARRTLTDRPLHSSQTLTDRTLRSSQRWQY